MIRGAGDFHILRPSLLRPEFFVFVIPGCDAVASPQSISRLVMSYGFSDVQLHIVVRATRPPE